MGNAMTEGVALVVVDVQRAFDDPSWGTRNNPAAESNVQRLLSHWRTAGGPIFHIWHRSDRPESLFSPEHIGYGVKPEAQPVGAEPIITKAVNSAFIGTDLEEQLRRGDISSVVICGITTDHCVSTTARMAGNLGFTVTVVSDATATFDRTGPDGRHWTASEMHDSALASLNGEFASVRKTDAVLGSD